MQSIATNPMVQPNLMQPVNGMATCLNNGYLLLTALSKRVTAFSKKVVLPFGVLIAFLFSGVAAFAQCPSVQGTITSSSNSQLCSGQSSSININVTPTSGGTFSGVFTNGRTFTNLTPGAGVISPSYPFTNNTFAPTTETFQLQSLTFNDPVNGPCPASVLNGSTNITVFPVSDLDAILNNSTSVLCNNTTVSISVTQPSGYGGTYNRSAQYNGAGHSATTNAANQAYGTFTDALTNSTLSPITVKYFFTPISPNSLQCVGLSDSIIVTINPNPTVTCPPNKTQSTDATLCTAVVTGIDPTFTPATCNGVAPTIRYTLSGATNKAITTGFASGETFNKGATIVTYSITDAAGNTGTACSFTVTVNDNELPVITCPSNVSANNTPGACSAVVTYPVATATDNCGIQSITYSQNSGTTFPVGITTVTATATDVNGNIKTCQFTVTVVDNEAPSITSCPTNITLNNANDDCGAIATFAAIASDNCPGTVITYSQNPGTVFPVGTTTVTVTATDAATIPNTATCFFTVTVNNVGGIYVNDAFTAGSDTYTTATGDDMNGNGTKCKPFASITKAVSVASAVDTIYVDGGTYRENNIVVSKKLQIRGHNFGINPNTGTLISPSIVQPLTSDVTQGTGRYLFAIAGTSGVRIDGFTIDGDNPTVGGGVASGMADINAAYGIVAQGPVSTDTITNNTIKNISDIGVILLGNGAATSGNIVSNNKLDNLQAANPNRGVGVFIFQNAYAKINNNVMTAVKIGAQTTTFGQADPGATADRTISSNTIESSQIGIWHNNQFGAASTYTIGSNTITTSTGATTNNGIRVSNIGVFVGSTTQAVITGNNITGALNGYNLWSNPTTPPLTITGGTVTNCTNGVLATNYDAEFPTATVQNSTYVVDGVTITGGTNGVFVKDDPLNSGTSNPNATVAVQVIGNTQFNTNTNGLVIEGASASATFPTGTPPATFAGQISKYIQLRSNGTDVPAGNIDATAVVFDGQTGAAATLAQNFATEDKIDHKIDLFTLGFVTVKAANNFVTTNSFITPNTSASVQRGVDVASAGFTVNLANGVYNGDVDVNKTITVRGQSQAAVIRGLYAGNSKSVRVSASNVLVKNVTITRDFGVSFNSNPGNDWVSSAKTEGIIIENVSNVTLDSALVTANRNGVYVHNVPGFVIKNSIIRDNRTGFQMFGNLNNGQIINNFITNNFTHGVLVNFEQGPTSGTGLLVNNNNISGNWYSQINFQRNTPPASNVGDFTGSNFNCNWYGTVNPDYSATAAGGMPYNTQVPTQFGGMDPGVNADIRGVEAALITYVPFLTNGADANAPDSLNGFQPTGSCNGSPIVIASTVPSPETCGGSNGSITVTFSGGVSPYTISTTGPVSSSVSTSTSPYTISGLTAGTYNITITDANGTFATTSAVITYNPVTNVTANPDTYFTTIQAAINAANPGDSITVCSGTYNEQVIVNKSIILQGLSLGPIKPIINYTGTPAVAARATLFDVTAPSVTIRGFEFRVNMTRLASAIIASAANVSNLTVQSNDINPYQSTTGTYGFAYGLRNAVSINYGTGLRVATNLVNILGTGNTINFVDNGVAGFTADDIAFRSGFAMDEASGTFDGNTIKTGNQDIQNRFTGSGSVAITNNILNGGGVEIAEQNAGAGTFTISGNTFNGTFGSTYTSALRLKNNTQGKTTTVSGNTFTGHNWGISLENYRAVTVNNNVFTPLSGSTTYRHITVNTKELSTSSGSAAPNIDGTFTNNTFNGSGGTGGLGLAFYNEDNNTTITPGPSPVFGTFTIGTSGNENNFNAGIGTFIYLDNNSGTTAAPATTIVPFAVNLDATNNKFDVGSGLELPSAMSLANLFLVEDKIQHKVDTLSLGFVLVKAANTYVTTNSFVAPSTSAKIQRGVEAASSAFTVNVTAGTFTESINVNKTLNVRGAQADVCAATRTGAETIISCVNGIGVNSDNTTLNGFTIQDQTTQAGPGFGYAVYMAPPRVGTQLVNNIIKNNIIGSSLANTGATQALIQCNWFDANNNPGPASGAGIYSDEFTGGGVISNVLIDNNKFSGHIADGGIDISTTQASSAATGISITRNEFTGNRRAAFLYNTVSSSFSNNEISNSTGTGTGELRIYGGVNNLSVLNNKFAAGVPEAIRITDDGTTTGTNNSNITVFENSFTGYTSSNKAIDIVSGYTGALMATCNWFGTTSSNTIATLVNGNVTYSPYLLNGTDNDAMMRGFQPVPSSCNGTPVLITSAVPSPQTCSGNGSITVMFSGGTGPYSLTYTGPSSGGPTTVTSPALISGLAAGTYTVTITDANGSFATAMATITNNPVTNVTQNMTYTTIQGAVTAANVNDSITVCSGTYNEQVVINKALKLQGLGPVKPIINYTGTPAVAARATLFDVTAPSVTIRDFDFRVNVTNIGSAILASAANVSNLAIDSNEIKPYRSGGLLGFGLRNAVSINYGDGGLRINGSNPVNISGTRNVITYFDNGTPGTADDASFRSGFAMDEATGTFDGNTIQSVSQDIQQRFAGAGSLVISNNNINGGGVEIAENNAGAVTFTVSGNTFNGTFGSTYTSALRLKNNVNNKATTVSGNTFTGHNWGISLENYRAVTVNNNVFTPALGSTTYRHITVNTKDISSSSGTFTPNIDGTFTNNTFNGSGGTGGLGLAFYNQDNDSPVFGTFTVGTSGNENNFNAGIGTFIYLDNTTGPTPPNATTAAPFPVNLDATNNKFDVGAGLESPSAMSLANLFMLEDKVQHKIDATTLGFVLVKTANTYVTPNSFVAPNTTPKVQRGVDAAGLTGFTENIQDGTYTDNVLVNKGITITGQSQAGVIIIPEISSPGGSGSLPAGASNVFLVDSTNVTIQNLTVDGNNPAIISGLTSGGVDVDARSGIITNHNHNPFIPFNGLNVNNVIVKNIYNRGIYSSTDNTFNISNNTVTNVAGTTGAYAVLNFGGAGTFATNTVSFSPNGIASNNSAGTTYTGNMVTSCDQAIHSDNAGGFGSTTSEIMSNNTVTSGTGTGSVGIFVYQPYIPVTVQANNVSGVMTGLANFAKQSAGTATFTQNTVVGSVAAGTTGVYQSTDNLEGGTTPVSGTYTNNFIQDNAVGFKIEYQSNTNIITANNNSITGNTTGVQLITGSGTLVNNFECNWWGSNNPTVVAAAVGSPANMVIDYTPYLNDGTDAAPGTAGFQPMTPCVACTTLTATFTNQINNQCNGGSTGGFTVTASGGVGPYTYTLSGTGSNNTGNGNGMYTGLPAGIYTVTATGSNGCSTTFTSQPVTITQPTATVPDVTLSVADATDNFFSGVGSEITLLYQVQENNGNPALNDTLRITKQGGYTFSFPNVNSVTIAGMTYQVDNQNWTVSPISTTTGPPPQPFYKIGINSGRQIDCGQSVFLAVKITRNTASKQNFALTSQVFNVTNEAVTNNNSTIVLLVGN